MCPELIAEVADVLTRRPRMRKWINLNVAQRYIKTIRGLAEVVPNPAVVKQETRDVDDDYLVALARDQAADYLVTGHRDLLEWVRAPTTHDRTRYVRETSAERKTYAITPLLGTV